MNPREGGEKRLNQSIEERKLCGFAGHFSATQDSSGTINPNAISHRGPDQTAVEAIGNLQISFCRLAINGVLNGRQPFINVEKGVLTGVNGEIYNHKNLRLELEALGAVFITDSDAEVVHWGFQFWSVGIFGKLEGMFAAVIFENAPNRLTFARDRLGKKPLYWVTRDMNVSFASELGALKLPQPSVTPGILASYMLTDAVAWEEEGEGSVRSLPGGHWAQLKDGEETVESFWNLEEAVVAERNAVRSRRDWHEGFLEVVSESVSQRLMSEVPVGIFLSDGKDSKLIAALASKLGSVDVAYTLKFDESSFDESSEVARFARRLQIPHEMVHASIDNLASVWELYRGSIDEPVADSAILGELLLARAAGAKTKVVLTGDGGDETLLGYQHVIAHWIAEIPGTLGALRSLLKITQPFLTMSNSKYFSVGFVVDRFLRGAGESDFLKRDLAWRSSFSEEQARALIRGLTEEGITKVYQAMESFTPQSSEFPAWQDQWAFLYVRSYLHHVILRKVDRATMRFGVEARSPLLDRKVVEYALAMPARHKRSFVTSKLPIDYALKKILGPGMSRGKKHGMGVPLVSLFRGPLSREVRELSNPDFLVEQGLFVPKAVENLVTSFQESPQSHVREIWSLLVFQNWWKRQQTELTISEEKTNR